MVGIPGFHSGDPVSVLSMIYEHYGRDMYRVSTTKHITAFPSVLVVKIPGFQTGSPVSIISMIYDHNEGICTGSVRLKTLQLSRVV